MDKRLLLEKLPSYGGRKELIRGRQSVSDIITEILKAHKQFAGDYDRIALYFNNGTTEHICNALYGFCKNKIRYRMESENAQTVKSPSAILAQGFGDCKHFASFTGGILDALNRAGKKIDWHYRFASYNWFDKTPGHIFVVVNIDGKEKWIDPTPGAENSAPVWVINKKPKAVRSMALYRVSGIGAKDYPITQLLDNTVNDETLYMAIQMLLKYGIMDVNAKVHPERIAKLEASLSPDTLAALLTSYNTVRQAAIGGLFDTIWRGVKKVTLLVPRNAFLSLVGLNVFGYATKLSRAIWDKNGNYTAFKDKLKDVWQNKLGGDWTALQNTIRKGATKKAIIGVAPAPAIPAWITAAGACIAAIMPIVNAFLNKQKQETGIDYNIDPSTGLPFGSGTTNTPGSTDPLSFVKNNPLLLVGGAAALYLILKKKK